MRTNDPNATSKATQPLNELREILLHAQNAKSPEEAHVALIDVVDGLITHAEKQARLLEDLRSDMSHKQSIVSNFDGGSYAAPSTGLGLHANDERDP
ncbi:hypothetical protein [Lichenifustis flavocetrariae]|uniref:Uncharacterized protein n=1 Tax=Lichenifustis flavocetrariae TaxID=2949735 RepID=A0AA41YW61_9HYPH|nr:hypothetical protein [Lichenifustis flavocetrariae]MCW6508336.1 hypothetical protein [Lichenifustis flavocetrariae]